MRRFLELSSLLALLSLHAQGCAPQQQLVPAATAASSAAPASRAPEQGELLHIDAELSVRRVARDAYVVTHEPFFASNVLVVRMADGTVVLCSSPFETQAARALVKWVRAVFTPARIVAINTHFHFDGTGGNEAYRELGVETWSTTLTRTLLVERGEAHRTASARDYQGAQRERIERMKLLPAEHLFAEGQQLHSWSFGGQEVRILEPGAAHAPDNLLVYFPAQQLLFGGCMIKGARTAGFLGDADLSHWPQAVEVARQTGAQIVVPGHGATAGPELFDLTREVVEAARAQQLSSAASTQ